MSGTKQRGTATYMRFLRAVEDGGGTVDIFTESRTFTVQEQAQQIDVTVRGDSGRANLPDLPNITIQVGGLDTVAGSAGTPAWDTLTIGVRGTVEWGPEGTAAGRRKKALKAIIQNKQYESPYDGVQTWQLDFASDGGSVVPSTW